MKITLKAPFKLAGGRVLPAGSMLDVTPQLAFQLRDQGKAEIIGQAVTATIDPVPWRYDIETRNTETEAEVDTELEELFSQIGLKDPEPPEPEYNRDNAPRRRKPKE